MALVNLFTYGTLTRRHRLEALCGVPLTEAPQEATLLEYERRDTGHGYPMILPRSGGRVDGWLWQVEASALPQIDH